VTAPAPGRPAGTGPGGPSAAQRRVFGLLDGRAEAGDRLDTAAYWALLAAIVVAVAAMVVGTVPAVAGRFGPALAALDWALGAVFLAEYAGRLWSAPADPRHAGLTPARARWRFARSPMALLDLAAVLALLLPHLALDLRQARLARLFSLLRVGKLGRMGQSVEVFRRAFGRGAATCSSRAAWWPWCCSWARRSSTSPSATRSPTSSAASPRRCGGGSRPSPRSATGTCTRSRTSAACSAAGWPWRGSGASRCSRRCSARALLEELQRAREAQAGDGPARRAGGRGGGARREADARGLLAPGPRSNFPGLPRPVRGPVPPTPGVSP
jgi:hypothetical protein